MSIKIEFLPDSDILIDGVPVEYQHHGKLEDAFLQLRAEIAERDARIAERNEQIVDLELRLGISRHSNIDLRHRAERAEAELNRLQMLAEHLVREPGIDAGRALVVQSERIAELTAELTRLRARHARWEISDAAKTRQALILASLSSPGRDQARD